MKVFSKEHAIEILNQSKYGSAEYIASASQLELSQIRRLLTDAFRGNIDKSSPIAQKKSIGQLNNAVTHFINTYRR
jgi:hypothetical protein